jgi:predicted Zn-dependent peptidase
MLNRILPPPTQPIGQINYSKAKTVKLSNGLPVHFINAGTQDVVKCDFIFEAGIWEQSKNLIASTCNSMLEEGSIDFTSEQIAKEFDFYGAYLQLAADQNYGYLNFVTLGKYLPEILQVTESMIKHSTFPEHELEVLLARNKQKFLFENEKVKTLSQKKLSQVLFGNSHPYAINNTIEEFERVSRNNLIQFYKTYYHSGNCQIIAAGKIDEVVLSQLEAHFGGDDWMAEKQKVKTHQIRSEKIQYHHVEKTSAVQSAIRMGKFWVSKSHPDAQALSVLVTILGGYFGSRLMTKIREEKGYTYGIDSHVVSLKNADYLVISTEVDNDYVETTRFEIINEIKRLQNELIDEIELNTVKNYLMGEFLRDFDGPFAMAASFKAIHDYGLDYSYYDQYLQVVSTIKPTEIQKLAKKHLNPEDFYTIVAGKKE